MFGTQYINTFIYEMGLKEPNLEKWKKIGELELWDNEWERVKLFFDLLAVCICHGALCIMGY